MITKWSNQNLIQDLEFVKKGENEFVIKEEKLVIMNLLNQLI